jgi:uncharacterized protein
MNLIRMREEIDHGGKVLSIAEPYQRAEAQRQAPRAHVATLGRSPRRWAKERDACGSNATRILKSTRARLEALAAVDMTCVAAGDDE